MQQARRQLQLRLILSLSGQLHRVFFRVCGTPHAQQVRRQLQLRLILSLSGQLHRILFRVCRAPHAQQARRQLQTSPDPEPIWAAA